MPTLNSRIADIVVGDDFSIRRTIDRTLSEFEAGTTITKAWLTVKAEVSDVDPGLFQKEVTTSDVPGTGQVEDDGTGDVDMIVRFDLVPADTTAIGSKDLRYFDVQVLTAGGKIFTPESGRISGFNEVTVDAT